MSDSNETSDNEAEKLRAQIEALKSKNQELIREKQAAKAAADQAAEEAEEAKTVAAAKNGDIEAVKAAHAKELAKLQKQIEARDTQLRTIQVDNAIAQSLTSSNIRPEFTEALTALLKSKAEFADGVGTIAGEPIADHIASYLKSDQGAHYVRPADNNGGGATGSKITTGAHDFTKDNFASRMTEWSMLSVKEPELAKSIALQVGRADLAEGL